MKSWVDGSYPELPGSTRASRYQLRKARIATTTALGMRMAFHTQTNTLRLRLKAGAQWAEYFTGSAQTHRLFHALVITTRPPARALRRPTGAPTAGLSTLETLLSARSAARGSRITISRFPRDFESSKIRVSRPALTDSMRLTLRVML